MTGGVKFAWWNRWESQQTSYYAFFFVKPKKQDHEVRFQFWLTFLMVFQLSILTWPVSNLHPGTVGKVNEHMNPFRLPNNKMKSDSYFC